MSLERSKRERARVAQSLLVRDSACRWTERELGQTMMPDVHSIVLVLLSSAPIC